MPVKEILTGFMNKSNFKKPGLVGLLVLAWFKGIYAKATNPIKL